MMIPRRSIIIGLGVVGLIASPAVVRAASIMSVKGIGCLIFPSDQDLKDTILFTIYGWDKRELVQDTNAIGIADRLDSPKASSQASRGGPIAIHLSQSWQASWT
jgi:hypothetical protein